MYKRIKGRVKRHKVKTNCAIKSANEYHNALVEREKDEAKCHTETGDTSKAWAGARAANHKNGAFSSEAYAGASALTEGSHSALSATGSANAEFGFGGAIVEAEADANVYTYDDSNVRVEVGTARIGGGLGAGPGGVKAKVGVGVDAVKTTVRFSDRQEMDASFGLNADTGVEVGWDGFSASVAGLGVAIGRNTGVMTRFGGVVFKLW